MTEDRAARGYALAQDANVSANGLKQNQSKYVQAGTGPAYWGPGDEITFLITGEETGGAVFMAELSVPPAGGPPPHIHHREDESFYVREGTLAIRMGQNRECGAWRLCSHPSRNRALLQEHRERACEDVGDVHTSGDGEVF
jgi:hypothetical protein